MLRFRRMKTLQKFSSVHASVHNLFNQERPPHQQRPLPGETLRRIGGVAGSHGLDPGWVWETCAWRRQVAIRLTAPATSQKTSRVHDLSLTVGRGRMGRPTFRTRCRTPHRHATPSSGRRRRSRQERSSRIEVRLQPCVRSGADGHHLPGPGQILGLPLGAPIRRRAGGQRAQV